MQRPSPILFALAIDAAACARPRPATRPGVPIATVDAAVSRPAIEPVREARAPTPLLDAGTLDAAPAVHWSTTVTARDPTQTPAMDGGALDARPAALAPIAGGGAIAFWAEPADTHGRSVLYARLVDADGRLAATVHRIAVLVGTVQRVTADARGSTAWVGVQILRPRSWTAEAFAVSTDLTNVASPVQFADVRTVDAEESRFLSLVAQNDGGLYALVSGRYHRITESELRRQIAQSGGGGGAPSGNPVFDWSLVHVNTDHVATTVDRGDSEVGTLDFVRHDEERYGGSLVAGPPGVVHRAILGRLTSSPYGWRGRDVTPPRNPPTPPNLLQPETIDFAQAWTGDGLVLWARYADDDAGVPQQSSLFTQLRPRADAADASVESTRELPIERLEITCSRGHAIVRATVHQPPNTVFEVDPSRADAFVRLDEFVPQSSLPDAARGQPLAWAGRALVAFDGVGVHRFVCSAPEGPLVDAPP